MFHMVLLNFMRTLFSIFSNLLQVLSLCCSSRLTSKQTYQSSPYPLYVIPGLNPCDVHTTPVPTFYTLTSALYSPVGRILPIQLAAVARLVLPVNGPDLLVLQHLSFLLRISSFTGATVVSRATSPLGISTMQVPCSQILSRFIRSSLSFLISSIIIV